MDDEGLSRIFLWRAVVALTLHEHQVAKTVTYILGTDVEMHAAPLGRGWQLYLD